MMRAINIVCWSKWKFSIKYLCYHTPMTMCFKTSTLHLAIRKFSGLTNGGFRHLVSKRTASQIPHLSLWIALTSPNLQLRWDALVNPWQITGQPVLGKIRSLATWNILSSSSCLCCLTGPMRTQISPSFRIREPGLLPLLAGRVHPLAVGDASICHQTTIT